MEVIIMHPLMAYRVLSFECWGFQKMQVQSTPINPMESHEWPTNSAIKKTVRTVLL